jgi:transcriptional regulator with XRE-family HTH domain
MYKNKTQYELCNICGKKVKEFRLTMRPKVTQSKLAALLQLSGLDIDNCAVKRIESGKRFVSDIELKIIKQVLNVSYEELLDWME